MPEIEVRTKKRDTSEISISTVDVNQLIRQIRSFTKKTQLGGLPFGINVDGFNFSVGQSNKNLRLRVDVDLGFKRKRMPPK